MDAVAEKAIDPTKIQATRLSPDCANCTPVNSKVLPAMPSRRSKRAHEADRAGRSSQQRPTETSRRHSAIMPSRARARRLGRMPASLMQASMLVGMAATTSPARASTMSLVGMLCCARSRPSARSASPRLPVSRRNCSLPFVSTLRTAGAAVRSICRSCG